MGKRIKGPEPTPGGKLRRLLLGTHVWVADVHLPLRIGVKCLPLLGRTRQVYGAKHHILAVLPAHEEVLPSLGGGPQQTHEHYSVWATEEAWEQAVVSAKLQIEDQERQVQTLREKEVRAIEQWEDCRQKDKALFAAWRDEAIENRRFEEQILNSYRKSLREHLKGKR